MSNSKDMMMSEFGQRAVIVTHCINHREHYSTCYGCLRQFNSELRRALKAEKQRTTPPTAEYVNAKEKEFEELRAELKSVKANAVKMLDEQDREYNRKTNEMIRRHSEQVEDLTARIKELEDGIRETPRGCTNLGCVYEPNRKGIGTTGICNCVHRRPHEAERYIRKLHALLDKKSDNE